MEAMILAGGLGTRLASRVTGMPKAMAPVAGRPFLEIILRQLKHCGCARVILAVGYLHDAIERRFGGCFDGIQLEYVIEEQQLGTGGAIRNSLVKAHEDSVFVLNGDTFVDLDYSAMLRFHREQNQAMTMAISWQPDISRYGGVTTCEKRIERFREKGESGPGWINAGVYVLRRDLPWPAHLGSRFSFEADFLMPEVRAIAPAAWTVTGFFLDIGVPEDYDRAQTELKNR